jgi:hypothetical protein
MHIYRRSQLVARHFIWCLAVTLKNDQTMGACSNNVRLSAAALLAGLLAAAATFVSSVVSALPYWMLQQVGERRSFM